ncbi:MAG: hypothetical protein KAW12_10230, partial [Candidatus Aminicenantes bacterium]|nr:hypothetical protein [Candidatus Aminicenantes bacterium]
MNSSKNGRLLFQFILTIFIIASGLFVMAQSAPTATTSAASSVGSTEAALNGSVNVEFTIYNSGATTAPFGDFETPLNGATVRNNLPVSGWVLDDIEVTAVSLFRTHLGSESSGLKYIGEAELVDGAFTLYAKAMDEVQRVGIFIVVLHDSLLTRRRVKLNKPHSRGGALSRFAASSVFDSQLLEVLFKLFQK